MTESFEPQSAPFRGLAFFTGRDEAIFAGREEEIEEVATRILAGDTLVVYGPSGVGKTSLLRAGVVPALERDRGYQATYVRPLRSPRGDVWQALGADPDEPLAAAIARLQRPARTHERTGPSATNGDAAHARIPHVLLLDQIEELFTRFDEAQCRPLWDGLVELLDDPTPVRLVLSLREDYLHLLDSAHPHLSNLLDRRFRLRGLTPIGARTAIVRPLVARGIRYAPELVDRCVAELTEVPPGHPEEDGVVDPLLLQTVCSELYRRAAQRTDKPSLELADYEAAGGLDGVLRRHLDELFNRVDAEDHLLLSLVLQEMTTAHATKRPATLSRILASGLLASADDIGGLLDKLVAARLVRMYNADPEPWYELIHDRLVQVLPVQFARDPQFLQIGFMRDLVRQLSRGFSERVANAPMLSLPQLADVVEPFRTYIRFNADELNLLFRSAIATEHEVASWGAAYEGAVPGGSPAILLELLGRKDTRRAAARAAGQLRITDAAVREVCMRLALEDPDEDVENAAADALAVIGGDAEVACLRTGLLANASRPRALRVLGALLGNPHFRDGIATGDWKQAGHLLGRARLRAAKHVIQDAARQGLIDGLMAGGLAGLWATLLLLLVMPWMGEPIGRDFAIAAWFTALGGAGLGTLCGWAVGRAMSMVRVLHSRVVWSRSMRAPGVLAICVGLPVVIAVFFSLMLRIAISYVLAIAGVTAGVSIIALLIAMLTVALVHHVPLRSPRPRAIVRLRIFLCATPLPWILAVASGYAFFEADNGVSIVRSITIFALFLSAAWGSVCAVAVAMACALSELGPHASSTTAARSAWRQLPWFAPIALVSALIWRAAVLAPPSFLAPIYDVSVLPDAVPRDPSSLPLPEASWTGGVWVRFRNESPVASVISAPPRWSDDINWTYVVWPGTHAMWFRNQTPSQKLHFPYRLSRWGAEISTSSYAVVDLERTTDDVGTWRLPGSPIEYAPREQVRVRLIGCRARFKSGITQCNNGNYDTSCELMEVLAWRPDHELVCTFSGGLEVSAVQAVVIFEDANKAADSPVKR